MLADRRSFLKSVGALTAGAALSAAARGRLQAAGLGVSEKHFTIVDVKRTAVRVPFREVPRRNMDRELPHWRFLEVCDVQLQSGRAGVGETTLFYTWGATSEEDVRRAIGRSAMELMWDDSLGAGLQMALFDAVARTADAPIHALLGRKVHETTPLSWWNIDTSAADMAAECREARRRGYRSYKTKGRPWFDIHKQLDVACRAVPDDFKIDMDFNDTLLTAEQGLPILLALEKHPQVDIYETPIPQSDVAGNAAICEATRVNVAMHYGSPAPATVVRKRACDGFVVGGGATRVMNAGRFAGEVEMPFWLQLVGSGITAAFSLHFGGVLQQARWPAVNCHQLFEHELLVDPIAVADGFAAVPDSPGLGYKIDRDAVARYRVDHPGQRPEPERLIETRWADGTVMYTASNGKVNFMLTAGQRGLYPYYQEGADTRLIPNDGSAKWRSLYDRARANGPVHA